MPDFNPTVRASTGQGTRFSLPAPPPPHCAWVRAQQPHEDRMGRDLLGPSESLLSKVSFSHTPDHLATLYMSGVFRLYY